MQFAGGWSVSMSIAEFATNVAQMPNPGLNPGSLQSTPRRLLDVEEVAKWLGVSKGWVRDHASGRRQPKLRAIKLGPRKGKGLWKFREQDVQQFLLDRSLG
jgi:predicted DNA-binding transcriptional regulator AlpA